MKDLEQTRKEILNLEKLMQTDISSTTAIQLAEKYVEIGEPVQAIAVLLESTEAFPDDISLHILCARYIIAYQSRNSSIVMSLLNDVLIKNPENLVARQLIERISTEIVTDTTELYDADLSDLPTLRTRKVTLESLSERRLDHDGRPADLLSEAFCCLDANNLDAALSYFQVILEKEPDNKAAQDGFRKTFETIFKENDRNKRERKVEIISRSIRYLEAMRSVAVARIRSRR